MRMVILAQPQSSHGRPLRRDDRIRTDGYLYVGMGDGDVGGEPASQSQDSTSLLGKMLRIDVDHAAPYAIPLDNPYVGRPGWRGEIWQLGLRNPWRWSFDRRTETCTSVTSGRRSGRRSTTSLRRWSVATISAGRSRRGKSATSPGGLLHPRPGHAGLRVRSRAGLRGDRRLRLSGPDPALQGTYFYGDFCSGKLRSFKLDGEYPQELLPDLELPTVGGLADNTVSFGEDADGELYVVMASGRIYRVEVH